METITSELAKNLLTIVDAGLIRGTGNPKPGEMCIEAAICYAMGLPHSDEPPCVLPPLRTFNFILNDARWSNNKARAAGLRRLAIAQLGSATLNELEFVLRLIKLTKKWNITSAPIGIGNYNIRDDGRILAQEIAEALLNQANALSREADWRQRTQKRDMALSQYAEDVVQLLIEMKSPGCAFLPS